MIVPPDTWKPLLPFTAVLYPALLRTITSAPPGNRGRCGGPRQRNFRLFVRYQILIERRHRRIGSLLPLRRCGKYDNWNEQY